MANATHSPHVAESGREDTACIRLNDITKGYYQLFIAEKVKAYKAFKAFMDIFEWLRILMGLKASASHFQAQMDMTVMAILVYIIGEVYVDSILVNAIKKTVHSKTSS